MTTVPAPSSDDRTALTGDADRRTQGCSRCSASRAAIVASRSNGVNEPPQPVKWKHSAWRLPSGRRGEHGPESRSHESSIGAASTSMLLLSMCVRGVVRLGRVDDEQHRLEPGDRVGDERVELAGGLELVAPEDVATRRPSATR